MASAYHTPDRKIEEAVADYIAQEGQDSLRGWSGMTRLNFSRKVYPQWCVVCRDLRDAFPQTIEPTGNWECEVEISIKSIIKRTTGEQHDSAAGFITDLMLRSDLIAKLNDVATDSEIRFLRGRVNGRTNDVDDGNDRQETVLRWHTIIVPHRTTA